MKAITEAKRGLVIRSLSRLERVLPDLKMAAEGTELAMLVDFRNAMSVLENLMSKTPIKPTKVREKTVAKKGKK